MTALVIIRRTSKANANWPLFFAVTWLMMFLYWSFENKHIVNITIINQYNYLKIIWNSSYCNLICCSMNSEQLEIVLEKC